MKSQSVTISKEILEKYAKITGLRLDVIDDVMNHLVTLIARTPPIKLRSFYYRTKFTNKNAPWFNSWWARLIRWVASTKIYFLIPIPLFELARAQIVGINYEEIELPEETVDCIHTQIALLSMKNQKPVKIFIGTRAYYNLKETLFFSPSIPVNIHVDGYSSLFGIPVEITDRLEENSVFVVGQ